MKPIRISLALTKVKNSVVARLSDKKMYICIPMEELFCVHDSKDAYLTAMMIETPNSQFSDFLIKPYVEQTAYESMSQDERKLLPIIGRGKFIQERTSKTLVQNCLNESESEFVPF